jgi:hypothetical protein
VRKQPESVDAPANYPCATFFVDESSAKESAGTFFVVGAIKLRKPGVFLREIQSIRDNLDYSGELKFSRISRGRLPIYFRIIDALAESDARIAANVVKRSVSDPFRGTDPEWKVHARITAQLLVGNINSREFSSAIIDHRSTPSSVAFDDAVRNMVNQRLGSLGLVSAVCADSQCTDGLQLADLIAGAVAHQRRAVAGSNSHKAKVAARLASAFDVTTFACDQRTDRVNVRTASSRNKSPRGGQASKDRAPNKNDAVIEMIRPAL